MRPLTALFLLTCLACAAQPRRQIRYGSVELDVGVAAAKQGEEVGSEGFGGVRMGSNARKVRMTALESTFGARA